MNNSTEQAAVVLGVQNITALNTVRSLAQTGIDIIGVSSNPRSAIARTSNCKIVHCQDTRGEAVIETLLELGQSFSDPAVLFATSDAQVLLISENRELLSQYYLYRLPSKEVVKLLLDKGEFSVYAERTNLNVPKTIVVSRSQGIEDAIDKIAFPCILKPYQRTGSWSKNVPKNKVLQIQNEEAFRDIASKVLQWMDHFIVQEMIEGADSEIYFCLMYFSEDSEPRASFVGRKIRQWPPKFGNTACAERQFNESVLQQAIDLFRSLQYRGLGSVEYKYDNRDDTYKLLEPTVGRPDFQSYVAVANGINIPYLAYCDLTGNPIVQPEQSPVAESIKWIHEWNEFKSSRHYLERGELSYKGWAESVRGPKAYGLFSFSDIRPLTVSLRKKGFMDKLKFLKFFIDMNIKR